MIHSIDHIVILVNDLAVATADYTALGFTVIPGGEHTDGASHNALIAFEDGAYLELIAFLRPSPEHHWWHFAALGEGIVDWALLSDAVVDDVAAAQTRDAQGNAVPLLRGPIAGGRIRPDGQRIAWQLGMPRSSDLPFLCGDMTPRSLRVPEGTARQHPNGAMGIAGMMIAVNDLDASIRQYQGLTGMRETLAPLSLTHSSTPTESPRRVSFAIGEATITLAQPTESAERATSPDEANRLLREHLERRGEGPVALEIRVAAGSIGKTLDPTRTHGVQLSLGKSE